MDTVVNPAASEQQEQGGHSPGLVDCFVGNANGRGLCRLEVANGSEGAGEHVASGPRGAVNEARFRRLSACYNGFDGLSTAQIEALGPGGVAKLREALAWYVSRETASPYWCDAMPTVGAELIGDARGAVEVAKLQAALEGLLPAYETMLAHLWADMPAADRASRQSALEAAQAAIGGGK